MQTWAKYGSRTAVVTGGMLAAEDGVPPGAGSCADRSTSPRGGAHPGFDASGADSSGRGGDCFTGELFPEEGGSLPCRGLDESTQQSGTALAGTIDPVRDLLPAVENMTTRELPHITTQSKHAARPARSGGYVPRRVEPAARAEPLRKTGQAYRFGKADPAGATAQVWIPPEDMDDSLEITMPLTRVGNPLELAGWVADSLQSGGTRARSSTPASGHPCAALDILPHHDTRGRHAREAALGTPSEGFHRSLSWSGSLGAVVPSGRSTSDAATSAGAAGTDVAPALVVPSGDPAVAEGLRQPESIVALWEDTLGRMVLPGRSLPAAVVSTQHVELTSGALGGGTELLTVPPSLLSSALSRTSARREPAKQETVPLDVSGELQERVDEIPDLSGLAWLDVFRYPDAVARGDAEFPRTEAPLSPVFGELDVPGESEITAPITSITEALEGHWFRSEPVEHSEGAMPPAFSTAPEFTEVRVTVLDELAAAVPERMQVVRNPFGPSPAPRTAPAGGMALPILTGGVPDIAVMQDETRPIPALRSDGTPVLTAATP